MKIKRGNYTELTIGPLCDEDDAAITDLDDALTVDFYVKRNRDDDNDDAVIHKGLDDGITIDSPAEGSMVIVLIDTDTEITPSTYFMAVEIDWGDGRNMEIEIKENAIVIEEITITKDIVQ